jgi:hypothetical protein
VNPKLAKLASLGAIGVAFGVIGLYVLIAFGARHTAMSGMDPTNAVLTYISVAVPAIAVIAAHLAYAKILFDWSKKG